MLAEMRCSAARRARMIAVLAMAMFAVPGSAPATELPATPQTLRSVFAGAQAGDTIRLAAGNYGRFEGALKPGTVTLTPQPNAAVSMQLHFDPASNITIDGVRLTDVRIDGNTTKNITLRNSEFTGGTVIVTANLADANILLDNNVHRDWDPCNGCYDGRVTLPGSDNNANSGVTISNSEFYGGTADGIQNGARATKILNNVFHDLQDGPADGSGQHTDAIQLYGSRETIIRGNYFYSTGAKIMAPDGAVRELIEDNVFAADNYPFAIMLWSDDNSTIRHNTLAPGTNCWFNLPCGIISLGQKTGGCTYADSCDPGTGTLIEDNILAETTVAEGKATYTSRNNLFNHSSSRGHGDARGGPSLQGGRRPTTYAGYLLADGSPGKGTASDGLDLGIRSRPGGGAPLSIRVLSSLRTIHKTGRVRLRIGLPSQRRARLSATIRPGRRLRSSRGRHSRRTIRPRSRSLSKVRSERRTVSMRVSRSARRILLRSRDARLTAVLKVGSKVRRATFTVKR